MRIKNSPTIDSSHLVADLTFGHTVPTRQTTETGVPPGGHWPRKGVGDVWPWRPPFHISPVVRKGPISSKRVSSQNPLFRQFWNFSLYSLNFCQNSSSQAPKFWSFQFKTPKFGNFQFTSPQIWNFQFTGPSFRDKYQFANPTLRKSGPHTPTWKNWVPPPISKNPSVTLCKHFLNKILVHLQQNLKK